MLCHAVHNLCSMCLLVVSTHFYLCLASGPNALLAVMLFISGTLLLYTAIIAPVQVFLWEFKDNECNIFPTLYFDIFVDLFFMVSLQISHYQHFLLMLLPPLIAWWKPPDRWRFYFNSALVHWTSLINIVITSDWLQQNMSRPLVVSGLTFWLAYHGPSMICMPFRFTHCSKAHIHTELQSKILRYLMKHRHQNIVFELYFHRLYSQNYKNKQARHIL